MKVHAIVDIYLDEYLSTDSQESLGTTFARMLIGSKIEVESSCVVCNGTQTVHCTECSGYGTAEHDCTECDGNGFLGEMIDCTFCKGGYIDGEECANCDGDGEYQLECTSCDGGSYEEDCEACQGRGNIPCKTCAGQAVNGTFTLTAQKFLEAIQGTAATE